MSIDRWTTLGLLKYGTEDPPLEASVADLLLHGLRPQQTGDPIFGVLSAVEDDLETLIHLLFAQSDGLNGLDEPSFVSADMLKRLRRRLDAAYELLRRTDDLPAVPGDRWRCLGLRQPEDELPKAPSIAEVLLCGAAMSHAADPIEALLLAVEADLATVALSLDRQGSEEQAIARTIKGFARRVQTARLLLGLADGRSPTPLRDKAGAEQNEDRHGDGHDA